MKHLTKIGLTIIVILLSQMILCNQTDRIKLIKIDFYSKDSIDFNLNDSLKKNGRLVLDYKLASRFSINYSVDSLSEVETIRYMINGFDNDWINDNGSRSIIATNLNPGNYQIKIGLFIADAKIEEKVVELSITPPFYKTMWFRLLFVAIIISVVIGLIIKKLRYQEKNN
jgi:hypothetical protein